VTGLSACQRAEKYINGAKEALKSLELRASKLEGVANINFNALIDAARRYIDDSEYYLNVGDCETAIVAASYAEGLIDSLKYMGVLEVSWPKIVKKKKVFVAGTFEIVHPGHIELLKFASRLGDVYVIVARDSTVIKTKGRKPIVPESVRLKVIKAIKYVKEAYLGHPHDMLESVNRVKPDVIVLGPDQPFDEKELADAVERRYGFRPKVVRLPAKVKFDEDMMSVRDIYKKVCKELCPYVKDPA